MHLDSLCLPVRQEPGQSGGVPSRSLQELFPSWTPVQGVFFIPALDRDVCLMSVEFAALRLQLTDMIQAFSV